MWFSCQSYLLGKALVLSTRFRVQWMGAGSRLHKRPKCRRGRGLSIWVSNLLIFPVAFLAPPPRHSWPRGRDSCRPLGHWWFRLVKVLASSIDSWLSVLGFQVRNSERRKEVTGIWLGDDVGVLAFSFSIWGKVVSGDPLKVCDGLAVVRGKKAVPRR